jgi:hypothetical protein
VVQVELQIGSVRQAQQVRLLVVPTAVAAVQVLTTFRSTVLSVRLAVALVAAVRAVQPLAVKATQVVAQALPRVPAVVAVRQVSAQTAVQVQRAAQAERQARTPTTA